MMSSCDVNVVFKRKHKQKNKKCFSVFFGIAYLGVETRERLCVGFDNGRQNEWKKTQSPFHCETK